MGKLRDNPEVIAGVFFAMALAFTYFELYPVAIITFVSGAICLYGKSVDEQIARLDKRIDDIENRRG